MLGYRCWIWQPFPIILGHDVYQRGDKYLRWGHAGEPGGAVDEVVSDSVERDDELPLGFGCPPQTLESQLL